MTTDTIRCIKLRITGENFESFTHWFKGVNVTRTTYSGEINCMISYVSASINNRCTLRNMAPETFQKAHFEERASPQDMPLNEICRRVG